MALAAAKKASSALVLMACLVTQLATTLSVMPSAQAMGPMPMPAAFRPAAIHGARIKVRTMPSSRINRTVGKRIPAAVRSKYGKPSKKISKKLVPVKPPQDLVGNMSTRTIAPGVVHKVHRGAMYINVLDVDLRNAAIQVKPVLASESFDRLDEVRDQAQRVQAIGAVNGNYFKHDGTPLGTLIIDGEWISGPLMDRTCLGITSSGDVLVDRVAMHGLLETSNPDVKTIWVNNINQPRRHGSHLIAYTRRWGTNAHMDYEGTMVAVDASGRVVDKQLKAVNIPAGGYALSDTKASPIARLNVGDLLHLSWHPTPSAWANVVNAVSGGPVLIRNGNLFVGLKDEGFRKSWTSNHIHARTAAGVTANGHLLLATIEGPHTLWDVAKFLKKLGAVDAINLDGGGSTTMVIGNTTVTKNENKLERRVASSLVIVPSNGSSAGQAALYRADSQYTPAGNIIDFGAQSVPPLAPSTRKTYELLEMSTGQSLPESTQDNISLQADSYDASSTSTHPAVLNRPRKHFGWMRRLNPLAD